MLNDLRYGLRMLAKSPGFTAAAILMLALGIGANTVIFGLLESTVRYQISNYRDYDRLYIVLLNNLKEGLYSVATYADYVDLRDHNQVFEELAATSPVSFLVTGGEKPERILGTRASTNLFSMLEVIPVLGRTFLPNDTDSVALLSHGFWQNQFGSDPNIVGKAVILGEKTFTVIGVLPADNQFPPGEVCIPYSNLTKSFAERLVDVYPKINMIGKVKRGLPFDHVRSDMNSITRRLERDFQLAPGALYLFMWHPSEGMSSTIREVFYMLQCAVGLVLLLACANVANLLVARAMARQREMATRLALGAGRLRLLRQLLTEGFLLSALGTIFGLLLAIWASKSLTNILGQVYPDALNYLNKGTTWNGHVLGFTVVVSLLTGILFSLVPALRASRTDLNQALKESMPSAAGFARFQGRSVLVMLQVSLALTVLIASGLLLKALSRAHGAFIGRSPEKVLTMTLSPNRDKYSSLDQMRAFYDHVLERVAAVPGVVSVDATAGNWPYTEWGNQTVDFSLEGAPPVLTTRQQSRCVVITPNYLRTLQIPLRSGRYFTTQDVRDGDPVVIINQGLIGKATHLDPIGRELRITYRFLQGETIVERTQSHTIVGVTADIKRIGATDPWQETVDGTPEIYVLYSQNPQPIYPPDNSLHLVVKATFNPLNLVSNLRDAVWAVDKNMAISEIQTMEQRNAVILAHIRLFSGLTALFGAVGMLLAAVGIYAVVAQFVSQRTRELGIRIALGAQRRHIFSLVLRQGLRVVSVGLAIGLLGAYNLTQLLASYLVGVNPRDPFTFLVVPIPLAVVALLACYLPVRRATTVDPIVALRCE